MKRVVGVTKLVPSYISIGASCEPRVVLLKAPLHSFDHQKYLLQLVKLHSCRKIYTVQPFNVELWPIHQSPKTCERMIEWHLARFEKTGANFRFRYSLSE